MHNHYVALLHAFQVGVWAPQVVQLECPRVCVCVQYLAYVPNYVVLKEREKNTNDFNRVRETVV